MTNRFGQWGLPNGVNYGYDPGNRIELVEQGNATQVFARSYYQYDKVSREVATWRDGPQDEPGSKGERFWYTPNNQVSTAWYKANNVWTTSPGNPATYRGYTYTTDKLNWSFVNDNGYNAPFVANALNQYTSVNGSILQYDDRFNLSVFSGSQYTHDSANQLTSVTGNGHSASFTYDGLGRCVRRVVDGVTRLFTYDGWNPIIEFDQAGSWKAMNLYGLGADEILGRYDATLGHLIYKQDKQGNVMFVLNAANQTVEKYTYDAYGTPTILSTNNTQLSTSAIGNRFMYTGREWIAELSIYDYRHRYYLPDIGRFLETDPTGFDGGDMNLFRYCDDDPVDRTDPTGLIATDWTWSHLMWQQGNSTYGFNDLYQSYVNAGASGEGSSATVTGMPKGQANEAPKSDTPTSDTTKSMKMTIATDPATGQQKFEDDGYYRVFSVQLTNANGKAQDGRGWYAQEEIKVRVNQCSGSSACVDGKFIVRTTNGRPLYELPRSGQVRDQVGQGYHPSPGMSGTVIKDQRWWLQRGTEHKYFLPGVLRQTTTVRDGKSLNSIAPTSVPWD